MKLPLTVRIVIGFLETVEKLLDDQSETIACQAKRIAELEDDLKEWKHRAEYWSLRAEV